MVLKGVNTISLNKETLMHIMYEYLKPSITGDFVVSDIEMKTERAQYSSSSDIAFTVKISMMEPGSPETKTS